MSMTTTCSGAKGGNTLGTTKEIVTVHTSKVIIGDDYSESWLETSLRTRTLADPVSSCDCTFSKLKNGLSALSHHRIQHGGNQRGRTGISRYKSRAQGYKHETSMSANVIMLFRTSKPPQLHCAKKQHSPVTPSDTDDSHVAVCALEQLQHLRHRAVHVQQALLRRPLTSQAASPWCCASGTHHEPSTTNIWQPYHLEWLQSRASSIAPCSPFSCLSSLDAVIRHTGTVARLGQPASIILPSVRSHVVVLTHNI